MYKAVALAGGIREPLLTCSSILLWLFHNEIQGNILLSQD